MPNRPKSHEVDRKALALFRSRAPDRWIVRDKDQDYGVDLEVEMFDPKGQSTSIVFYVQMKGTSHRKKLRSVQINRDRIDYLVAFDVPSIICRACVATGEIRWMWASDALWQSYEGNNPVTLHFSEGNVWTDQTPELIEKTARFLRTAKGGQRRLTFSAALDVSHLESIRHFDVSRGVNFVFSRCPGLLATFDHKDDDTIFFDIRAYDTSFWVGIGGFASISFDIDKPDYDTIVACTAYSIAYHLSRFGFEKQARGVADFIWREQVLTHSRQMAAHVITILADNAEAMVDVALRARIHELQDDAYARTVRELLRDYRDTGERHEQILRFYDAALRFQVLTNGEGVGSIHYSIGNFLLNSGNLAYAFKSYNIARKHDVNYLARAYFWRELGGLLFWRRKFRWSSQFYNKALEFERRSKDLYCYADALFYAADFDSASVIFAEILEADSSYSYKEEVSLRFLLCEKARQWQKHRANFLLQTFSNPRLALEQAKVASARDNHDDAYWLGLAAAFQETGDSDIWAFVLMAAILSGNERLVRLAINCTLIYSGEDAYAKVRQFVAGDPKSVELLGWLDGLLSEVQANFSPRPKERFKIRALAEDKVSVFEF